MSKTKQKYTAFGFLIHWGSFLVSAIFTIILYREAAGSNVFFQVVYGSQGFFLEGAKIRLWEMGKKRLAILFVALSLIGTAASAFYVTQVAARGGADATYVNALNTEIASYDAMIKAAVGQVDKTPGGYGTAVSKIMIGTENVVTARAKAVELLRVYNEVANQYEAGALFKAIGSKLNFNEKTLLIWFILCGAVLLEIAALATTAENELGADMEEAKGNTPVQKTAFFASVDKTAKPEARPTPAPDMEPVRRVVAPVRVKQIEKPEPQVMIEKPQVMAVEHGFKVELAQPTDIEVHSGKTRYDPFEKGPRKIPRPKE